MNKKLLLFLLILVSMAAVTHVSAADDADIVAQDNSTEVETESLEETIDSIDDAQLGNDNDPDDGQDSYRNIQYAIDRAEEGDTIYLNGNYTCDYLINVYKPITIEGNGAVIKYNGSLDLVTPFFNIEKSGCDVVLNNISFVGGIFFYGGAITWQGDNGILTNCKFIDNNVIGDYAIGGAMLILGENCSISNCTFTNNRALSYGGAILSQGAGLSIDNCEFNDNVVSGDDDYGGALVLYADNCTIINSTFNNNHCKDHGGAIASLDITNVTIRNCEFYNNYVLHTINETILCGGGAIFSISEELTIDNCTFIGNHADEALGGAISLYSLIPETNNTIINSFFDSNSAAGQDRDHGNDIYYNCHVVPIKLNYFVIDYEETIEDAIYPYVPKNYLSDVLNNTFNKTKRESNITFSPGMVFEYGDSGSINVTVTGGTIDYDNVRVLNHTEAKITFSGNEVTVSGLDVGDYVLIVPTSPDENHTSVEGELNFTVTEATAVIKASALTVALKSSTTWSITLVDSRTNKPIANMELILNVYTGSKYITKTVKTNSKGVASYQTKTLAAGNHKIIVKGKDTNYKFNTLTKTIKVIKQTPLKFKLNKRVNDKKGSLLSYYVLNSKGKGVNGIKIKVLIYTGKTYKTYTLTSKKIKNGKKVYNGAFGFSTNNFKAGKHTVKIMPVDLKYKGSVTTYIKLQKSATKGPKFFRKV